MTRDRRRRRTAGRAGGHRPPRARGRVHGRVPRLRAPRPGLRRRRPGAGMTAGTRERPGAPAGPTAAENRRRYERPPSRFQGPAWLDGPMTSCHLVLGAGGLLLVIGLVMVFSASSIEAALADEPAWKPGVQQVIWAGLGLGAMFVALRLPTGFLRRWSPIALIGGGLPAAAGADPGDRGQAQRRPPVVRPRVRPPPALGGGQARLRSLGRARPGAAGALPDDVVAADPGAAGLRGALAAAHRRAGLRGGGHARPRAGRPALGGRHAGAVLRLRRRRRRHRAHRRGDLLAGTDGPAHLVPRPLRRPDRGWLPGDPRHVRAGHRRAVGRGARQQRDEVEPAAARRVRLHLRDHRRGARLPRLPGRGHPLRRARLRRLPDRPPLGRPVRPAGQRGDHRLAGRPGRDEHGLRGRAAAGDRRDAPVDLRRGHLAGADPVHHRAARPVRPLRAGGDRGPARPDPRPAGPLVPARARVRGRPGAAPPRARGPGCPTGGRQRPHRRPGPARRTTPRPTARPPRPAPSRRAAGPPAAPVRGRRPAEEPSRGRRPVGGAVAWPATGRAPRTPAAAGIGLPAPAGGPR